MMPRHSWLVALVLAGPASGADPAIRFDPPEPLTDETVHVQITGLTPDAVCRVRARATFGGKVCQAEAAYRADAHGAVDLRKQAPVEGTYTGADPMGLFWSMRPTDEVSKAAPVKLADPRVTASEVEAGGKTVARAELKRWQLRPGVRVTTVTENGLVGRLFEPERKERRAAVLVLSGSEGGMSEGEAALLASHGYVTFALAYFGAEGLPKQLVNIPLEYLKKGLDWLAARDSVDAKRLGVTGGSKGGELALLLAAHFPELKVVVARAPSSVAWSGLGGTFREASWTFEGKPVPFLLTDGRNIAKVMSKSLRRYVDLYAPALDDESKVAKALIPVERIGGAVLLVSGTDDAMWPASRMSDQVAARLKEKKHPFPVEHLKYEAAGHGIPSACVPTVLTVEAGGMALGGSAEANARAQADSRPKVLRFLRENLKGP